MRKTTFFLSLLLFLVGVAANAQNYAVQKVATIATTNIMQASELVDGGYYAFYNVGRSWYIQTSVSNRQLISGGNTFNATSKGAGTMVFKLNKTQANGEDAYTFESVVTELGADGTTTKLYIPAVTKNGDIFVTSNEAEAEKYKIIANSNGNFNFQCTSTTGNMYIDGKPGSLTGWDETGDSGNGAYKIYPVTLTDNAYDYSMYCSTTVKEGETVVTENVNPLRKWDGETYDAANFDTHYYTTNSQNSDRTVSATNCTFTVSITKTDATAPITFSIPGNGNETWYKLEISNNGRRTLKAISEDNTWHVYTDKVSNGESTFTVDALNDYPGYSKAVWAFVENNCGVKLYNKGTGRYLKWVNTFAELVDNSADASTFFFATNSDAGFSLYTGYSKSYLNASGWKNSANDRLGAWNANGSQADPGSCFLVEAIDLNEDLVGIGKTCLSATLDAITANEPVDNYVTFGTQTDIDKAKAAAGQATRIAELDTAYLRLGQNIPALDPNAVYRILSAHGGFADTDKKYISTNGMHVGTDGTLLNAYNQNNNMDRKVYRVPEANDFMSQLWQFEPNEDGKTYKVKSANVGAYWCNNPNDNIDLPVYKGSSGDVMFRAMPGVNFSDTNAGTNDGKSMFQMVMGGHFINAFNGKGADYLKAWDQADDAGGYWRIKKVTEVPLTISSVSYASVGFPFAVQVPSESNVKAYYATKAGNGYLTLKEITDGIIPAGEGAILYYEGGTQVNLGITTTDNTLQNNKLKAANAKRTGFTEDENYLLAVDRDNEVKFLQAEITTVPANKAYLPASELAGTISQALAFNFGNSTGISDVVKDSNKDVRYYDLNGRRVLFPSNGIFITNTGKKVFIK